VLLPDIAGDSANEQNDEKGKEEGHSTALASVFLPVRIPDVASDGRTRQMRGPLIHTNDNEVFIIVKCRVEIPEEDCPKPVFIRVTVRNGTQAYLAEALVFIVFLKCVSFWIDPNNSALKFELDRLQMLPNLGTVIVINPDLRDTVCIGFFKDLNVIFLELLSHSNVHIIPYELRKLN